MSENETFTAEGIEFTKIEKITKNPTLLFMRRLDLDKKEKVVSIVNETGAVNPEFDAMLWLNEKGEFDKARTDISYWIPEKYFSFNYGATDGSPITIYMNRETTVKFAGIMDMDNSYPSVPSPTENPLLVFHTVHGNDVNSSSMAAYYMPMCRDMLDEDDEKFNEDIESSFIEPTILLVSHCATWCGNIYITKTRATTIGKYLKQVLNKF